MGLLSGVMKAGLAKKAIEEGRKPENQRKIKGLLSSVTNRGAKGGGGAPGRRGRV